MFVVAVCGPGYARKHFAELDGNPQVARLTNGTVRVMVDIRKASVQLADAPIYLSGVTRGICDRGLCCDRIRVQHDVITDAPVNRSESVRGVYLA